jgi:hypothetical protein
MPRTDRLEPPDGGQVMTAKRQISETHIENMPVVLNLRDYFAAAALTGLLCEPRNDRLFRQYLISTADRAYEFADAMLDARAAGNTTARTATRPAPSTDAHATKEKGQVA